MLRLTLVCLLSFVALCSAASGIRSRTSAANSIPSGSGGVLFRGAPPAAESDMPAGRTLRTNAKPIDLYRKNRALAHPTPRLVQLASVQSGLSGTYHIPGDFPNIASAVAVLNFLGLAGDATFLLDNALYHETSITF